MVETFFEKRNYSRGIILHRGEGSIRIYLERQNAYGGIDRQKPRRWQTNNLDLKNGFTTFVPLKKHGGASTEKKEALKRGSLDKSPTVLRTRDLR